MKSVLPEVSQLSPKNVELHQLQGFVYSCDQQSGYRDLWKKQLLKNQITKAELLTLGRQIKKEDISVSLLKGFALLGDIYEDWGARFASDVDFLVSTNELGCLHDILLSQGFELAKEKKWIANNFKYTFQKKTEILELTFEVHTKLFWHVEDRKRKTVESPWVPGFSVLQREEQLLHLCGHLGFQHTFLKLFWLIDVDRFVSKYKEQINWDYFWQLAREDKLLMSSFMCLYLVLPEEKLWSSSRLFESKTFILQFKIFLLKKVISPRFLMDPHKKKIRYLLVKNLIKDNFRENILYWFYWLKSKLLSLK